MFDVIVRSEEPILLVGGGDVDNDSLRAALSRFRCIVAADSGADSVLKAGGMPDAVIGDMDSISRTTREALDPRVLHEITEQDSTDFDKCLRSIDAPLVVAMGFLGQRVDHELAAFTVLARRSDRPCILIGREDVVALCPPVLNLEMPRGTRVSLWPLANVTGRSTGLHWPIDGITFAPDAVAGTSNHVDGPLEIAMDAPSMLLILPVDFSDALSRAIMAGPRWVS